MSEGPAALGQMAADAALVDVGAWQVISATGADRLSFLHRLLTTSVEDLLPGQGGRALLLTIKGHVVVELRLCVRPDEVTLLVPPGQGDAAVAALSRYAIMDDVALALQPERQVLALYGPAAAARLGAVGVAVPAAVAAGPPLGHAELAWAPGPEADLTVIHTPGFGADGFWLLGAAAAIDRVRQALISAGVGTLPAEAAEGLRIAAGEPKFGVEITPEVFPMEVGLDDVIDYGKGCYLGQEPIVRIRDRGHVNRRLVGLRLPVDAAVAAGDLIETDERPRAGRVTSAARLAAGPVALALVHVSVPVGGVVRVRHDQQLVAAEIVAVGGKA